ncbi:hypothetical protein BGX29_004092, partial [Mortierella sp. GBA35]
EIMSLTFKSIEMDSTIYMSSILYVSDEKYIDDSAIDIFLKTFKNKYGDQRNLFISQKFLRIALENTKQIESAGAESPIHDNKDKHEDKGKHELVSGWPWDWGKEDLSNNTVDRVFGIYQSGNHWLVACVDFKARRVFYGDSISYAFPVYVRRAIIQWLISVLPGTEIRDRLKDWTLQRLDMPQQRSSGSCGLIAANAIECILDPKIQPWSRSRPEFYRMRLLKMLMKAQPF